MILGETYRKIREEKGISISSLAGAEISKSQISRFELGETEISVFKLLYLLERIGVTLEEFLLICNHYRYHYDIRFWCFSIGGRPTSIRLD